uniref:N-acetyltransferase domain-containing protein n=1 Tax=Tetradesmus obliquus TaxID=3088 RepID=A0A383V7Z5_TETOB|eukprot:jgi/Sobl393_1/6891/SZX61707.1
MTANGAASAGVEAAAEAAQQQQEQQQPSSMHLVIDVDASEEGNGNGSSSKQPAVVIKTLTSAEELQAVARLRAEAYYAEDRSRFADSFKKQFAAQEVESLRSRTSGSNGRPQMSACLVALQPDSSKVLGCIDIRLPQTATGTRALGVPEDDAAGCYLLNVVVSEDWRGQGIGKALMAAAMAQAVHVWGAQRLYTHVEADNEVASGLYKSCGFREHSSEEKYANTLSLGRLVLLIAAAADAPAVQDTLFTQQA